MNKSVNAKIKYKFRSSLFSNKYDLNENDLCRPDIFDNLPSKEEIFTEIEVQNNTKKLQKISISEEQEDYTLKSRF
jgi:hypothetical protein